MVKICFMLYLMLHSIYNSISIHLFLLLLEKVPQLPNSPQIFHDDGSLQSFESYYDENDQISNDSNKNDA